MEDGQVAGEYAPNRTEDDPEDLEYHGNFPSSESDSEDESSDESTDADEPAADADTRAADPGAAAQGGTRDPSFEQFLNEWSDDDNISKVGDSDAASRAKPPRAPTKHASTAASSSGATIGKVTKAAAAAPKGKKP